MNTLTNQLVDTSSFADRLKKPDLVAQAAELIAKFDPQKLTLQEVLRIGQSAEQALAANLDQVLLEFNSENSPFVFEAFKDLQDGIKDANLDELEERIKRAKSIGLFGTVLRSIGLGDGISKRKFLEFTKGLSDLLKGKRQSLLDLVQKMEGQAKTESESLMKAIGRLDALAESYLTTVDDFALAILYIDGVLEKARNHLRSFDQNGMDDVATRFDFEHYEALIRHLENRRLILITSYENIPNELKTIAMGREAAANTFIEVSSSLIQQLNSLKSSLAKWAMLITIENSQAGDTLRRQTAEMLLKHGVTVLDRVAIAAARTPYERRLADAELMVALRSGITLVQAKVIEVERLGRESFAKAERILIESRETLALPKHEIV